MEVYSKYNINDTVWVVSRNKVIQQKIQGIEITAYKDNTYSAYYIDDTEGLKYGQAYLTRATLPVISLRSDTIYVSGTGTEADPFMIK